MPGKKSGYHPGIPQSEPFSKWDADKDEVEVDYKRMEGGRRGSWFSGPKGVLLRILLVMVIFSLGLIMGYVMRRSVHEVFHSGAMCAYTDGYEGYSAILAKEGKKFISADSLRLHIENYTASVHLAGTHDNNILGKKLGEQMAAHGLLVKEARYSVLLSYPNWENPNVIYIVNDTGIVYQTMYSGPPEAQHPELTDSYSAFSPAGTVQGDLVYANFGEESDFMELEDKNVSCEGKIVIMRYGRTFRGDKVKLAEEHGAAGVILYSDPEEVTRKNQDVYPKSWYLPDWAAQRGTVGRRMGDPLTPGMPSIDGVPRLAVTDAKLPSIPVQPVGYLEAEAFMENMAGPNSTDSFHGGLAGDINYRLGPGYGPPEENLKVKMKVNNQLSQREITNVFGLFEGAEEPDRYVIVGCHYDAWTFGADPNTGTAIMMEIVKALSNMAKHGWKPRRTILFAHWDAHEQGLMGSYEWIEEHQKELSQKTIAYLNLDGPIRGDNSMRVYASPLLRHLTINSSRTVPFSMEDNTPANTLFDLWRKSNPNPEDESLPQVLDVTSGSDSSAFLYQLGIPCFQPRFYKPEMEEIPAYHTPIDNLDYLLRFVDPHLKATEAITNFVMELVLRLAMSTKIPFDVRELAQSLETEFDELRALLTRQGMKFLNKLDHLQWAIGNFTSTAAQFHQKFVADNVARVLDTRSYNDRVMQVSRAFVNPEGLPGNGHIKNVLFAPTNKGADASFTGIRDAFASYVHTPSRAVWNDFEQQVAVAMLAVQSASRILSDDLFAQGVVPDES